MASFELDTIGALTKVQQKLFAVENILWDEDVMIERNEIIGKFINPFVPMKTGALRESMEATPEGLIWGGEGTEAEDYAHYQHEGIVYGPNLPGWFFGQAQWRSKGSKYPTGRRLGMDGFATLRPRWVNDGNWRKANASDPDITWSFGYTTPNTMSNWEYAFNYDVKREAQLEITRMLYRRCKEEGI